MDNRLLRTSAVRAPARPVGTAAGRRGGPRVWTHRARPRRDARRRAVRLPRRRRPRGPDRRPARPRLHRDADEHAPVGRAPGRRRLRRPLPAAARPRHALAGRQHQHPRPVDDGGRRGVRRARGRLRPRLRRRPVDGRHAGHPAGRGAPGRRRRPGPGEPGPAHPAARREAAAADRADDRQLGPDRQRHQEAGRRRAGLPQAADPGDDAAPAAVGGHPRRPAPA